MTNGDKYFVEHPITIDEKAEIIDLRICRDGDCSRCPLAEKEKDKLCNGGMCVPMIKKWLESEAE